MTEPTLQERYDHLRENAAVFVDHMEVMIKSLETGGNEDLASKLKVWCLMPWRAALRDDAGGDLWWVCESCGEPVKSDADLIISDSGAFHQSCAMD